MPRAISILLLSMATATAQHLYCDGQGVAVADGALQLERQWQALASEDFESGIEHWQVLNYEGKLDIGIHDGGESGSCVRVTSEGTKGDTAFELTSQPLPVGAGARFRFSFSWRANRSFARLAGHKGKYMTELQWLDAAGQPVGQCPFTFGKAAKEWQRVTLADTVPANTASVVIRFGCDHPNVADKEFLDIDNVRFEVETVPPEYHASGQIISRPLRADGVERNVSWDAAVPDGSSVRLRIASAPDDGAQPGAWSEPLGPDGTPESSFDQAGTLPPAHDGRPWVRYVAVLETRIPAATPVLRRVRIGDAVDGPWAGLDTEPPEVREHSPTRTGDAAAPIWFRLADGVGVDRHTLRVRFDGADITGLLVVEQDRYTYRPPRPLTPPDTDVPLTRWRVKNYERALTIARTARRGPDLPAGFHITREAGQRDTAFRIVSPKMSVAPGATYRLSYWSRHSMDLTGAMNGKRSWCGGVTWVAADESLIGARASIDFGDANPDWHADRLELTAPDGAVSAEIAFGFDHPNIHDSGFVDIAELTFDGPRPEPRGAEPNLHQVALSVADFAGNSLSRSWYVLIRPPRTSNVVTLRTDGVVQVDGEPFFPIGLYAVWKKPFNDNSFDKAFADLEAAGFNFAHTYNSTRGSDFTEFCTAAERHGIKLYVASDAGANCADVDTVLWDVVREEGQPSLLAWYLADDTASHIGHDELRTLSQAIRDVDPAHITVQADGVGTPPLSRYARYVRATDGFLPELYPIRGDSPKGVPRIIADMKTVQADLANSGAGSKTVWAIIQYFQGWGWPRYPTREELWAMSYLAIIHGANGITWYTYGGWGDNHGVTDSPDQWQNICALASELAQLKHVLTEPTGAQPTAPVVAEGPAEDALGYPSISTLLKDREGRSYLLAANSAEARVLARFSAPTPARIEVPFEDRTVAGGPDGFTDTFDPYAVHVYVWSE